MRWRVAALVSVGVNVVLAALWLLSPRQPGSGSYPQPADGSTQSVSAGRTNVVVRRQFFSWRELESPDYAIYVANLRDIGCPEQTIRDIIIADVNALYARRMATELVTAEQQWWRSEPDTNVIAAAAEKARTLDEERRGLLARLLGSSWEARDMTSLPRPSRQGFTLDGPVLGLLSSEAKQTIQDISLQSEQRMQAYLESQRRAGREPDPAEIAKLRQQTRYDLARVLSPAQLEEFLLRYSQTANNWRSELGQLQFFNASPEEFRAIFRATDGLDQRIELLGAGSDPNTASGRQALQQERENAIRLALGPKRYQEYRLLQDPLYRDAMAKAIEAGNPQAAQNFYLLNLAAAEEQERIESDPTLSDSQKNVEMRQLDLDQLKANTVVSGQDLPPEPPQTPPSPPRRTYTLGPGDTPAVVALIYGVPVSALRDANPNLDFRKLRPGDSLIIPRNPLGPGHLP